MRVWGLDYRNEFELNTNSWPERGWEFAASNDQLMAVYYVGHDSYNERVERSKEYWKPIGGKYYSQKASQILALGELLGKDAFTFYMINASTRSIDWTRRMFNFFVFPSSEGMEVDRKGKIIKTTSVMSVDDPDGVQHRANSIKEHQLFHLLNAIATHGTITEEMLDLEDYEKILIMLELDLLINVVVPQYNEYYGGINLQIRPNELANILFPRVPFNKVVNATDKKKIFKLYRKGIEEIFNIVDRDVSNGKGSPYESSDLRELHHLLNRIVERKMV